MTRRAVRGRRQVGRAVYGLLVVALGFGSGCGAVDDDLPSGSPAEAEAPGLQVPVIHGSSCGEEASTDPDDLRSNRIVARCGPGAPAAEPLDEPVTLKVAVHEPGEDQAPLLLADHFGELAEEGIALELVETSSLRDAYARLRDDEVDAVATDLHAAFLDMVTQGDGARLVLGGAISSAADNEDVDQAGLWVTTQAIGPGPSYRWRNLADQRLAVEDGISGASAYPLMDELLQGEASLNDMDLVLAGDEAAAGKLLSGDVIMAWLEDPHWQLVADHRGFELTATRPQEALGGVVLHERLLDADEDRDVGLALTRAIVRTINTHLPAGYRDDDEVVAALAETTGWTEQEVRSGPSLVFDWEIRTGTIDRMQAAMLPLGAVVFEGHQDGESFIDRSLYEQAVSQ